jgi:hypothetical protein
MVPSLPIDMVVPQHGAPVQGAAVQGLIHWVEQQDGGRRPEGRAVLHGAGLRGKRGTARLGQRCLPSRFGKTSQGRAGLRPPRDHAWRVRLTLASLKADCAAQHDRMRHTAAPVHLGACSDGMT